MATNAVKNVAIRLFLDGDGRVVAGLSNIEQRGKQAFATITTSARGAIPVLQAFVPLLGVATTAGVAAFAKESLTVAANLGDVAEQLGITTDRLQDYRFAAQLAGAQQADMDRALVRFAQRLGDAARGEVEAQSRLAQLGIHWRDQDGNIRRLTDAWGDFVNRIAGAKDEAEALSILGRTLGEEFGAKIANALRQGTVAFDEAGAALDAWGGRISAQTIERAREFDDFLDRMETTAKAWAANMATASPSIVEQATKPYRDFIARTAQLYQEFIGNPFARLIWPDRFGGTTGAQAAPGAIPPGVRPPIAALPGTYPGAAGAAGGDRPPPVDPKIRAQYADALAKQEAMFAEDMAGAWKAFNDYVVRTAGESTRIRTDYAAAIAAAEEMAADDAAGAWKAYGDAQAKLADEGQRIWEETRTPLERYNEKLEELGRLLQLRAIDQETYGRAVRQAGEDMQKETRAQSELIQAIEGFGRRSARAMADWAVGIDQANMSLERLAQTFASEMLERILYKRVFDPLATAAGGFLDSLFTEGFALFHDGGLAGAGTTMRHLPSSTLAGARRYHGGGLAPNEVPAILTRGEEVLTRRDPRHVMNGGGAGVTVQIVDQRGSGAPVQTEQSRGPNGEQMVRVWVRDEVQRAMGEGRLDRAFQRNYALARAPVYRG